MNRHTKLTRSIRRLQAGQGRCSVHPPATIEKERTRMPVANVSWPDSLWAAMTPPGPDLPELIGTTEADVVVIGGGFTGLSTALHLREAGVDVAIVEAVEPGWGASGRNNGQVIPTLSRHDPEDIIARHGAAGERFVGLLRDSASVLFDLARRYQIQAEQEQTGWVQPVHSPGRIKIAERRVRQWSKFGASVELLSRDETRQMLGSDAWFGGFWIRSGGHINPLALSRGLARVLLDRGGRIYARSPAASFERRGDRWVVKTDKGTDQRPGLDRGDQRLHRRVFEIADAGYRARSHAGAVLANGDAAAVGRCPQIHYPRPAGDVRYAWRALFRALRCAEPSRHRRRRDRTGQQGGTAQAQGRGAIAKVVAADRAGQFRLCLERLRRNDHGFPAPHSSSRTRRLWLDRLQRSRGCAVDRARRRTLQSRAWSPGKQP